MTTVGFIGLGDQGAPMARAVGESEHDLHVWARRPESLQAIEGTPYTVAASVAELAGAQSLVEAVAIVAGRPDSSG
jgi:3-hydroxyisobutyrate dehydrogenase-like beta-hydroxyacid dehydrogenase